MRIGIDCRKIYDVQYNVGAGIERYIYHFVKTLLARDGGNEYVLFFSSGVSPETIHKARGNNPRVKIVRFFSRLPFIDNHLRFPFVLKKEKLEQVIFPAGSMPLFYFGRSILIVHDLAIYRHPEWFPDRQWFSTKIVVPASVKKAETVIAVSEKTKEAIISMFNVAGEKIKTIYPGVTMKGGYLNGEAEKLKKKYGILGEYLMFVGTIEPRKNIINLIRAFSNYLFENNENKIFLAIAGAKGWKHQLILRELNEANKRLRNSPIKYLGKISNRERNILIKNSAAFIFPSHYEGFGFPVVEAMALGVPVIAGDNSSLKEIVGDAGCLVNSDDLNDIRRGIKSVIENKALRTSLIQRGYERASFFNWDKTAQEFQALLKRLK